MDDVYRHGAGEDVDDDWQYYAAKDDLYDYLRDKRGYDAMDEYIRRDVLKLKGKDFAATEELVSECASRVHNTLMQVIYAAPHAAYYAIGKHFLKSSYR